MANETMMMPYQNPGELTWYLKVKASIDGPWKSRTTGVKGPLGYDTAVEIAKLMHQWRQEGKWKIMEAIVAGALPLKKVMGYIDAKVETTVVHKGKREKRSKSALADAVLDAATAKSLLDWLDAWEKDKAVTKWKGRIAKATQKKMYIAQMRRLIGNAPLTLDWFADPENVRTAIDNWPGADCGETRRKYKTACSQFAKFLLRKNQLLFNPVADGRVVIELTPEELQAKKEPKYYREEEVRAFVEWEPSKRMKLRVEQRTALPTFRALHALLFGSGIEMQVANKLKKSDFDMTHQIATAGGEKNGFRDRMVGVMVPWCWKVVKDYLNTLGDDDYFIPRSKGGKSKNPQSSVIYGLQTKAAADLGIENLVFHKQRHSFTVYQKPFLDKRVIQDQLGHAPNSTIIDTVYGKSTKQEKLLKLMKTEIIPQGKAVPAKARRRA